MYRVATHLLHRIPEANRPVYRVAAVVVDQLAEAVKLLRANQDPPVVQLLHAAVPHFTPAPAVGPLTSVGKSG
jgi:hypothetical protein